LLSSIFIGCINQSSSRVGYTIDVNPPNDSETTLIIPLVIDNKSDEIDEVMLVNPRFPEGSALLEIIRTDKGHALKIVTHEKVEIKFSKYYEESGAELRANKTLSMTNLIYDENGKTIMKSWVYLNSTSNQTTHFWITLMAGDKDRIRILDVIGRNVTNGWHQFTVEEGYGIS